MALSAYNQDNLALGHQPYGQLYQDGACVIIFGNKTLSLETVQMLSQEMISCRAPHSLKNNLHNTLEFYNVKQCHGVDWVDVDAFVLNDINKYNNKLPKDNPLDDAMVSRQKVVDRDSSASLTAMPSQPSQMLHAMLHALPIAADALVSTAPGKALLIRTADCLPIALHDAKTQRIAMVHSGWRGVVGNIVGSVLKEAGFSPETTRLWVGPHIQFDSFQVDGQVWSAFHQALSPMIPWTTGVHYKQVGEKYYINLGQCIKDMALTQGLKSHNITLSAVDTLTHPDFFSHRGGAAATERNCNMIFLKNPSQGGVQKTSISHAETVLNNFS